jgi:hypothetical protein
MANRNQGIKSKNVTHRNAPKIEPRTHAKVPAGIAQIGQRQGNHFTNGGEDGRMDSRYGGVKADAGRGYEPVGPTSLMNNGPKGQGRNVYSCGVQGTHGNANPGKPMAGGDPLTPWTRK